MPEYYDVFNFEEDLVIDPDALDVAWLEQPLLYLKYSNAAAHAEKVAKRAHEKVKLVRSDLIKKANMDPKKYMPEGVKPTAQNVEAFYREHPDHIAAKEELIETEYEANVLKNAVFAFSHRKTALEEMVRLLGMQYYAGPKEPRNIKNEWGEHIKETGDKQVTKKMQEKRTRKRKKD